MPTLQLDITPEQRLGDRWRQHAASHPDRVAVTHWTAGADPVRWTWRELVRCADRVAGWLIAQGVLPGQVCAIILRHDPRFYPIYLGVSLSGALPAVLAYPNARIHPDKFRQGLKGMADHSGLDWILTEQDLEPTIRELVVSETSTIRGLLFPFDADLMGQNDSYEAPQLTASSAEPCLLQHSSGTTGLQKAVVLSHRAVLGHIDRYGRAIDLRDDDRIVSWLPLYHDMGLIAAFHLSLATGTPLVQLDPFEWVQAPVLLLEAIAREMGTVSWLPNFAFHLMANRVHDEDLEDLRLDGVRIFINCSEPVRAEAHEKFVRRFESFGIRPEMMTACYAMAETTFAVTQSAPGQPAKHVVVDRASLAEGTARLAVVGPETRTCVSSGRPITDCEIRIVNSEAQDLADDRIGEILIRSASMFDGYRNNPEKTAEVLDNGWYRSGDFGFRHQEEYYVVGRKKDLIIIAGKNIYPEDIEDALGGVAGVIPGRVVAFGVDDPNLGTEQLAVVLESEHYGTPHSKPLQAAVVQAGMDLGVTINQVYVAPPRWLIKSSAGKPSRQANRERALNELRIH